MTKIVKKLQQNIPLFFWDPNFVPVCQKEKPWYGYSHDHVCVLQEKMENGSLHNFCFSNHEQVLLSKSSCYILWWCTCLVKFLSQVFHSLCQLALTRCYLKERKKALKDVWKRTKLCHDFVFIIVQWGKVHKACCILSWWDCQCESIWMLFIDLIKSKW